MVRCIKKISIKKLLFTWFLVIAWMYPTIAQKRVYKILNTLQDSSYIENYSKFLTTRVYSSKKSANFGIRDSDTNNRLKYRPNDNWNLGVGFNYSLIGINIGINFPFINNDDDKYGNSKSLDLQSHVYSPKLAIDFIAQYYKGFYLNNSAILTNPPQSSSNYIRPDIYTNSLGLSVLYIFNDTRYSFRSFFLQNEWQKKSAGSWLFGGGFLGVKTKGDSSLIPSDVPSNSFFYGDHFNRIESWMIAMNGGYAYTYVYKSHWFVALSLTGGVGIGVSGIKDQEKEAIRRFSPNIYSTPRGGIGYNSRRFFSGISFVYYLYITPAPFNSAFYRFGTGNIRVNIAYRFTGDFIRNIEKKKRNNSVSTNNN